MNKRYFPIAIFMISITSCNNSVRDENDKLVNSDSLAVLGYFGEIVNVDSALKISSFLIQIESKDSLQSKIKGRIADNCKHSGCWMDIDLENGKMMHVKFKDERFTIPLDSKGKDVIIKGMAYRKIISVDELKKIALDEGLESEVTDTISIPLEEITFIATGVFILGSH